MTSRYRSMGGHSQSDLNVNFVHGGTSYLHETIDYPDQLQTMSDVVTPNFRARIRAGEIINNNCVLTVKNESMAHGSIHYKQKSGDPPTEYSLDGHVCDFRMRSYLVGYLPVDVSSSERRAKLVALANIDSTPYAFGEDLGELGETIRFLKSPFKSLLKLTRRLRRQADKRFAARPLSQRLKGEYYLTKDIASVYLQYQFALMPLVRSVQSAIEAYSYIPKKLPPRLTARGFSDGSESVSDSVTGSTYRFDRSSTATSKHHASVLYEVSNPVRDLQWRLGLRVKDVPVTVWQLMPLSFMVDRLVDVQSSMKAVTNLADPRVKILAASVSRKTDSIKTISHTAISDSGWTRSGTVGPQKYEEFTYARSVWHPSLSDTIPEFTPGHVVDSATKIMDAVALIRVLLLK